MKEPFSGMYDDLDDLDDLDDIDEDFEDISSDEDLEEPRTRRSSPEHEYEDYRRILDALEWVVEAADTLFESVEDDLGNPDVDAWVELRDAVRSAKGALQADGL